MKGLAPVSQKKARGHDGKGPYMVKRYDTQPSHDAADAMPIIVRKSGKASEKKGPIGKIGDKTGHQLEECPRCTHLIMITEKARPHKTRCPKCNMIVVVK